LTPSPRGGGRFGLVTASTLPQKNVLVRFRPAQRVPRVHFPSGLIWKRESQSITVPLDAGIGGGHTISAVCWASAVPTDSKSYSVVWTGPPLPWSRQSPTENGVRPAALTDSRFSSVSRVPCRKPGSGAAAAPLSRRRPEHSAEKVGKLSGPIGRAEAAVDSTLRPCGTRGDGTADQQLVHTGMRGERSFEETLGCSGTALKTTRRPGRGRLPGTPFSAQLKGVTDPASGKSASASGRNASRSSPSKKPQKLQRGSARGDASCVR